MDDKLTPIEDILSKIPLASTPLGRATVFGGIGGTLAYAVRPSMSFYPDGRPREWILVDRSNPEATLFPWWAYIVVPAALFGVFV